MMGSSGCMEVHWSMVKHLASTEAQEQTKSTFSKGKEFSVETCAQSQLPGPVKVSRQHPYLLPTFQAPLDLLGHVAQVAGPLAWQPGPVMEPSLALSPTQNQKLFESLSKWPE